MIMFEYVRLGKLLKWDKMIETSLTKLNKMFHKFFFGKKSLKAKFFESESCSLLSHLLPPTIEGKEYLPKGKAQYC